MEYQQSPLIVENEKDVSKEGTSVLEQEKTSLTDSQELLPNHEMLAQEKNKKEFVNYLKFCSLLQALEFQEKFNLSEEFIQSEEVQSVVKKRFVEYLSRGNS